MSPENFADWVKAIAFCFHCSEKEARTLFEGGCIADTPIPRGENSPKEKNQTVLKQNFDETLNGSQTTLREAF